MYQHKEGNVWIIVEAETECDCDLLFHIHMTRPNMLDYDEGMVVENG